MYVVYCGYQQFLHYLAKGLYLGLVYFLSTLLNDLSNLVCLILNQECMLTTLVQI